MRGGLQVGAGVKDGLARGRARLISRAATDIGATSSSSWYSRDPCSWRRLGCYRAERDQASPRPSQPPHRIWLPTAFGLVFVIGALTDLR